MSGTSMAYGVLCLLSMMLAAGCYYRTTYREFRLQLVFVAVLAVNTGYFMLSISKTLEGALMANSLAYLGSAALQPAMLLTVTDMCKVRKAVYRCPSDNRSRSVCPGLKRRN